jgi:hypothetical protein
MLKNTSKLVTFEQIDTNNNNNAAGPFQLL